MRECEEMRVSSITIAFPIRLSGFDRDPGPDTGVGQDTAVRSDRAVAPDDDRA